MQCVNISIVGDSILETNESFLANLTTDDPSIILSPSMATINILNDDSKYVYVTWCVIIYAALCSACNSVDQVF